MVNLIFYLLLISQVPADVVINEIQVSPGDTVEWLELRVLTQNYDIYGIRIISSQDTAIVNIHTTDSVMFVGENEIIGNLIFNDSEDSIELVDSLNNELYNFYYSDTSSFSWNTAKTPLPYFSASNFFDTIWDPVNQTNIVLLNFYIDSTATPGQPNDDYGWISGYVYSSQDSTPLAEADIHAEGLNGFGENIVHTDSTGYYIVYGLGIDMYTVCASKEGYNAQCYLEPVQVYPDSVVTGIDFYLTPLEVKESKKFNKKNSIKIMTFQNSIRILKEYEIFDIMGRRIDLPLRGIYVLKKDKNKARIIFLK